MRQGDSLQTFFYFLKKLNMRLTQVVWSLISTYFDSPKLTMQ